MQNNDIITVYQFSDKGERENTMKKKISLIAAAAMLTTSLFGNSVFAAKLSDVTDNNRYRNAIITLNKMAVIDGYEDGTFKPEGQIKRGEFTKLLMTAMGYGANTTEPTEFSDVKDHWAKCYIKTAYDLKIINGFEDGTFKPDDLVTYEQALKMMVCALNYGVSAEAQGGYPAGYIKEADDLKLTSNVVSQAASEPALRQIIAQVVYNALEVEMMEYNSGKGMWEKSDKTLLNDYLKVKKVRGTLIGAEDTKTNECNVTLIKDQIAVKPVSGSSDIIVLNLGGFEDKTIGEFAKLLGNEMTFYYRQGDNDADKELKILDDETSKNSTLTVNYKNLSSCDGKTFKYVDGPSTKSLKLADDVTVIYNGQAISGFPITVKARRGGSDTTANSMSELLGYWLGSDDKYSIRGEVKFTDTGDTGVQKIVSINDYKTMIAYKSPTTSNYRLQNKLKSAEYIDLNPDDISRTIYIEKNGKAIKATEIKADDVVSYAESIDGSILNVYVVSETITGTVNSINDTEGTITISNKEYDLGEGCKEYIHEKEGKTLSSGQEGTFYLDKLGAVVYGKLKAVAENPYAYITAVNEASAEDTAYVTLYLPTTSTKGTSTYKLASKVKINGVQYKTYSEAVAQLKATAAAANPDASVSGLYTSGTVENADYSQPVRVKVSGNEISEINTLDSSELSQNEDSAKIVRYKELKKYYYNSSNFRTGGSNGSLEFTVNSKTTVLFVPQDRSEKNEYTKKTPSNAFKGDANYWVEAYDVNKSNVASLVIMYGSNTRLNTPDASTAYSIVAKKAEDVYDSAEDTTTSKITVYENNTQTKSWTALNSSEFSDVAPGDVIQFAYDDDNKIQQRKNIIKYSDVEAVLNDTAGRAVDYDGTSRTEIYNWNEETTQTAENQWQKYKFDFKFPKSNLTGATDSYYVTTTTGIPKSQICIYNVYKLIEDSNGAVNKIYVTKEGFEGGQLREDVVYDEVSIASNTKFLRMEGSGNNVTFSPYSDGIEEAFTARELKDSDHYGADCSKVMVVKISNTVRQIVVLPEN